MDDVTLGEGGAWAECRRFPTRKDVRFFSTHRGAPSVYHDSPLNTTQSFIRSHTCYAVNAARPIYTPRTIAMKRLTGKKEGYLHSHYNKR